MSAFHSLAPRPPASLETVHNILGSLVARYRQEEVLTAVRQIPAREANFRPMPAWVTSALAEAYRGKGIRELYSHQASIAELVRDGKNVVVVTPTASGKTLCYNLPVLNAVLENPDTRALYLFPTKALAQDQLTELQDLSKRLHDGFGVFTYDGDIADLAFSLSERQNGIFGLLYALGSMATLLMMCDRRDLGTAIGERPPSAATEINWEEFATGPSRAPEAKEFFEPNLYIYDAYPGGIGFSEPLYRACETLLERTLELINACSCENGCPCCVGPTADRSERTKQVALEILRRLCGNIQFPVTEAAETA